MENVIAVIAPKGGVGKTTTALNLSGSLARMGSRILLVDNDWQGSATIHAGYRDPDQLDKTLAHVLLGAVAADQALLQTDIGITLLPGNSQLANVDVGLLGRGEAGVYRLREVLAPVAADMDAVVIDCEPGLTIRSLGALAAADYVLVPISADYLSLKTLQLFLSVMVASRQRYRMPEQHVAVVVTRYNSRLNQAREVLDIVRELAPVSGYEFWDIVVPERTAHRHAAAQGSVVDDKLLRAIYDNLAERVLAW